MLSSFWFGSPGEGPVDPPVAEGHRGITVHIDGQAVLVDVDVLAEASGLFLQVKSTSARECPLEDFPGGLQTFRQIVHLLTHPGAEPSRHGPLQVAEDNVLNLFEAAWLLECPKVFDEVVESAYMRSLSSRRAAELLEHLLPFTTVSSPAEGLAAGPEEAASPSLASSAPAVGGPGQAEEFMRIFLLETMMWQRTERAALELAAQLDTGDFVLGPRLATGSLRVCCELLRLQRRRADEVGFVSTALQPMSTMWKNLIDKPLRAKVAWDSHLFALQCIRKRLPKTAGLDFSAANLVGEQEEDDEAKADISTELCEAVSDRVLLGLVELVEYVDIRRAPPNWTALLLRTLILAGQLGKARQAFKDSFPESPAVRLLAWRAPAVVPPAWLCDVAEHVEASRVLLNVLAGYRELRGEEFCDIVENVLLVSFLPSPHCVHIILSSELIDEIVGACFDAGRKAKAAGTGAVEPAANGRPRRCPDHWAGAPVLWRLERVGTRLFAAAFVPQAGFLPHPWPDYLGDTRPPGASASAAGAAVGRVRTGSGGSRASASASAAPSPVAAGSPRGPEEEAGAGEDANVDDADYSGLGPDADLGGGPGEREPPCRPEPLVVKVPGRCLWDEGLLDIELLRPTLALGRAAPHEPVLHFGRQVVMRHLWYSHRGTYCPVPRLADLWELACWPLCEDAGLIREALEYLKGAYRELQGQSAGWCPEHEEALFRMFAALDLSRLPGQALLSPWVPAQVQAVRLLVQQLPAEQFHVELQQEIASAAASLKKISSQCVALNQRLNVVDQRTVINKSQINDAIGTIEEHQRKKREPTVGIRRIAPPV